jgi:hypothetical protein
VQYETPDAIRGRVSAVNSVFIGASNELGEFESGLTASWFGLVRAIVVGGAATLVVTGTWMKLFPVLSRMDRFPHTSIAMPGLDEHVQSVVSNALHRFGEQITRVEVHLSDNLGQKSADGDNRCMMEARLTGYQPIAVSDHAATLHQAIGGSADKLKRAIDSALGACTTRTSATPPAPR